MSKKGISFDGTGDQVPVNKRLLIQHKYYAPESFEGSDQEILAHLKNKALSKRIEIRKVHKIGIYKTVMPGEHPWRLVRLSITEVKSMDTEELLRLLNGYGQTKYILN